MYWTLIWKRSFQLVANLARFWSKSDTRVTDQRSGRTQVSWWNNERIVLILAKDLVFKSERKIDITSALCEEWVYCREVKRYSIAGMGCQIWAQIGQMCTKWDNINDIFQSLNFLKTNLNLKSLKFVPFGAHMVQF